MPPDADELTDVLRRDYARFSPAQQALARYLVDHVAELPLVSAHEVAQAAHCSPATVVRFAQALGYAGYPELQRTVRQAHRPGIGVRAVGAPGSRTRLEVFDVDRRALEDVAARLGTEGVQPLVAPLVSVTPIVIAGDAMARPIITLLEERLSRAGRETLIVDSGEVRVRMRLGALGRGGGLLAVSIGKETRVAEYAVAAARAAGAPAVALVDSSLSAASRAPVVRVIPAEERGGEPSLTAFVAVAQALAQGIAAHQVQRRTLTAIPA
ncbi:MAG: MurR/RpiR family transcriptional regulator [Thermoleophilia bacterium]|nr:MurR/RpiR family transcriptional regulator [Thermoleophilia bacterium]